ncbi:MAG: hypothetical protein ACXWHZ_03510 [Usitatibacter sp.]
MTPTIPRGSNIRPNTRDWIAIEDGLPVDGETVLVIEYGRIELQRNVYPAYLTRSRGITAWMYAPELP